MTSGETETGVVYTAFTFKSVNEILVYTCAPLRPPPATRTYVHLHFNHMFKNEKVSPLGALATSQVHRASGRHAERLRWTLAPSREGLSVVLLGGLREVPAARWPMSLHRWPSGQEGLRESVSQNAESGSHRRYDVSPGSRGNLVRPKHPLCNEESTICGMRKI